MFILTIVTTNANHGLVFKDKPAATAAMRKLEKLITLSVAESVLQIEDDNDSAVIFKFSNFVSLQLMSVEAELDTKIEREVLTMHSDLKKGERFMSDPQLRDAQAKAAARARLVTPTPQ